MIYIIIGLTIALLINVFYIYSMKAKYFRDLESLKSKAKKELVTIQYNINDLETYINDRTTEINRLMTDRLYNFHI